MNTFHRILALVLLSTALFMAVVYLSPPFTLLVVLMGVPSIVIAGGLVYVTTRSDTELYLYDQARIARMRGVYAHSYFHRPWMFT